jgi:SAM-dependent methyltransferase
MTGEFVTAGHLGGYVRGGDPDTLYPEMWAYLVEREGIRSVLDVGCGDGAALAAFKEIGVTGFFGIDGLPQPDPMIGLHDFTTGPYPWISGTEFDLVWSAEFVEHVEEAHVHAVMDALTKAPLVLMTHALPGQPGWHHVNCRESVYWIQGFRQYGFALDDELTAATRARAHGYYAATGLAFRRQT